MQQSNWCWYSKAQRETQLCFQTMENNRIVYHLSKLLSEQTENDFSGIAQWLLFEIFAQKAFVTNLNFI